MFQFQFNTLLTIRKNLEEVKKKELGVLHQAYQMQEMKIHGIEQAIRGTEYTLKEKRFGQVDIKECVLYKRYLADQEKQLNEAKQTLLTMQEAINLKKDEVVEAMRERKIMDNFKELRYQEYLEEEKRSEHKRLDEIVSYRYTQQGKED